jgi:hypothetical protein
MGIIATPISGYQELSIGLRRIEATFGHIRISGPFGESEDKLEIDLQPEEVESALAGVSRDSARQVWIKRSGSVDGMDPMREIGERLFSALFRGQRTQLFWRAKSAASAERMGLRVRLSVEDPSHEWAALPWECMHDGDHFINLSPWSPLVRTVRVSSERREPVQPPLHVLAVAVDVVTGELQTKVELDVLRELETRSGILKITAVSQATRHEFLDRLRANEVHVLHFMGRTGQTPEGQRALILMGEEREPLQPTSDANLDQLIDAFTLRQALEGKPEVRLVFVNSCHSARLAAELAPSVPATIGMLGAPESDACIAFSQAFYDSLVEGGSLEDATTVGRQMVDSRYAGSRAWGMPVLYLQAPDGVLLSPPSEGRGLEAVLSEAEQDVPGKAPKDRDHRREWQKLQMRREMLRRNLMELEGQTQASMGIPLPFVDEQIHDAKEEIAALEEKLLGLESRDIRS